MGKTTLTNEDINDIIRLYENEIPNTHKLAERFKVGHKKISQILKDNNIQLNSKGGQISIGNSGKIEQSKITRYASNNKKLVARCKKTGFEFEDANNLSGCLTKHIVEEYGSVPIPTNTYQRKKYEIKHNKKWFEEYFDIIEMDILEVRRCSLCDWVTEDINNKSGCFENHINKIHNINIFDYIEQFKDEIKHHNVLEKQIEKNKILSNDDKSIICLECNNRFIGITNTHMKHEHNMSIDDYKKKWGNKAIIISNDMIKILSENAIEMNKILTPSFTSKPQLEIKDYIENELGLSVLNNNKKALNGIEIDLLIPDLNIGIEYNGLYWH